MQNKHETIYLPFPSVILEKIDNYLIVISFNEQYVPINCMNIFNRIEQRYRSLEERLERKEE